MANIVKRDPPAGREVGERRRWDPVGMMRELLRWDPFGELDAWTVGADVFSPRFDVKETRDGYIFRADLPGIKDDDVEVVITGNRLTVSGRREHEQRTEGERYFAAEVSYGCFSRSFTLPQGSDPEQVKAGLKNGVLEITIPKRPEVQPRKVAVAAKGERDERVDVRPRLGAQPSGQAQPGAAQGGRDGSSAERSPVDKAKT
jgi:HSP20 family protein